MDTSPDTAGARTCCQPRHTTPFDTFCDERSVSGMATSRLDEVTSSSLSPRCMGCMIDKYLYASPADTPWRRRADYMRRVLRTVADLSPTSTAPEISHELAHIREEMFGIRRDFTQEKRHFNDLVLGLSASLEERMMNSDDPLALAIRCALVGNFIDFGPTGDVSEAKLMSLMDDAATMEVDEAALSDLKDRIERAKSICYLTDNCGEIVLDKLLIARIRAANPEATVTAIVRGAPTSNDATYEDACQVGLDQVARILDNGSDIAGTVLKRVNEQTREALRTSDLVISKGLANLETLMGRGTNAYYLFLCKCALYVEVFDVPLYTGMIVRGVDTWQL